MIIKRNLFAVAAFATLTIVGCEKETDTTPQVVTPTVITKVAGFEDVAITTNSYYNGDTSKTNFVSTGVTFQNTLSKFSWGDSWEGFSVSNQVDNTTLHYNNQYTSITGVAANSTNNYGIGINNASFILPDSVELKQFFITNTTYAALTIDSGYFSATKFGTIEKDSVGTVTRDGEDWFLLQIKVLDKKNLEIGVVDVYLADFRAGKSEVLKTWKVVDFSAFTGVKTVKFELSSSDNNSFGMLTPAYFAIDEITYTK